MKQIFVLALLVIAFFSFKGRDNTPPNHEEPVRLTAQEEQDAQDFAQSLVQSRDYQCNTVTMFTSNSYTGNADILCDDVHRYRITKPGGRWKVETM